MKVALGADHGGYALKEYVKKVLAEDSVEFHDFGTFSEDSVDYPDYAQKVAEEVAAGNFERGILICGTGIGMEIAANKVPGVRAALVHDVYSAQATRQHNDANILTMGGRVIGPALAGAIVKAWLSSRFEGGRHARRLEKIRALERKYSSGE
ncbi:MAG: ribose 5-phosphate isomerase B [Firmicutes bacterium]|nr:ribose 5-phosphate isomerase B [Bacillota bacterium]MCL5038451.1 ribose 5-phosphate isomerase B [Bacillota bacterium]